MAINLENFTGKFKGGARPNLFVVQIEEGPAASINEDMKILGQGASLPAATIGEIIVPYMGRQHKIPGNRTYDTWDITIINDTDFKIRNAYERWLNGINNMSDNEGLVNPADYQVDAFVDQLDRNGNVLKSYTFRGMFPLSIDEIALGYGTNNEVESFTAVHRYQYFETNTTT